MYVDRGFLLTLEAKPGKGEELAAFLTRALPMAVAETGTIAWYAFKLSDTTYGIFDAFADEEGRQAHFDGEIAAALATEGPDILAKRPEVLRPEIIAAK